MNFFAQQARARGQSRRLVVLFALAVVTIVVAIATIVVLALDLSGPERQLHTARSMFARHHAAALWTAVITLSVIGIASLAKMGKLRAGGGVVARELGATLIGSDTNDARYRRLRNVVEEVAIASGVPVPEIYVLEQEDAINAFAAGYTPADAAVTVTRGALQHLSRDELQGVVAHEFSHVLNGDMRLNIRLMGVLFGILVIGIVGREFLLRVRGGDSKNGAPILLMAIGVMAIGFIGLFFGRLIKAGISRQREYLADASAVQFTRQADGIAGALQKIAALPQGSKFTAADGEEVSHMLFGDGVGYSRLFATHPPLVERIRRIVPRFDPRQLEDLTRKLARGMAADDDAPEQPARKLTPSAAAAAVAGFATSQVALTPKSVSRQVANPSVDDYQAAGRIAGAIPEAMRALARGHDDAPALVLALALDSDPAYRKQQLDLIETDMGFDSRQRVERIVETLATLDPMQRLPLAQMAFPALRRMPRALLKEFAQALERVVHADGIVQLGEYCLARMIASQVIDALDPSHAKATGRRRLNDCRDQVAALLAILAANGNDDAETARRAYLAGIHGLLADPAPAYAPLADWTAALDRAFAILDVLNPPGKQLLVEGLVRCMSHDGRVALAEAELLRTVCAALHCPLPPMLAVA